MEAVFFIEKEKYSQARDKASSDELVSKQSLTFKDSSSLGLEKEGYYLLVSGSDEGVKAAKGLLKGLAEELKGDEAEKVRSVIKEQEEEAMAGFGGIFGG